jgi:hypothetical protein
MADKPDPGIQAAIEKGLSAKQETAKPKKPWKAKRKYQRKTAAIVPPTMETENVEA